MAHKYIGLQGILDLLGGARGREGGEYKCICPVHDDHKPTLYLREGDKGIIMDCKAGCDTKEICARLGISMADLFREPPAPRSGTRTRSAAAAKAPAPAKEDKPARTCGSYAEAYNRNGNQLAQVYRYTNSEGKLLFEVARLRTPDGGKTFRQHRPVKPDGSGRCTFPIRLDVPAELRDKTIYRQPEVDAAVAAGLTVYIVEGEKDADTMAGLGLCATTNAGGAGKWREGHTAHLKDATEVVLLPDNDKPGEEHVRRMYREIAAAARSVYIVHLKDGYKDLKDKGDFTDLCEAVGPGKAVEILRKLVAAARESPRQLAEKAYAQIEGYGIVNGRTCQLVEGGGAKVLCSFVALPTEIIETDDGATVEKSMRIMGWSAGGRPLKPVNVSMARFKTMDWALEAWDLEANIMPGNTVKDKLRWVMSEAGLQAAERKTVYSHCGWRRIAGKWAYLHQGGAIGAENVNVDMSGKLSDYTLGGWPEGMSEADAAMTSYELSLILPEYISVPMLGVTYLAPLCEFLNQALIPPSFVPALIGRHGTHKTGIAALFLNHYGRFGNRAMPANFMNTANAIRELAFTAKDAPLVIDDYHPPTSVQNRRRMEDIMQNITRMMGDKADRLRMNADLTLRAAKPARGIALISGENLPDIGGSGQARMYIIELDKSSYTYSDDMDKLWQDAEDGALRMAMSSYIRWLLPQADELPARLREMFTAYRKKAHALIAGSATNDRADDAVAHIMMGLTEMMGWLQSLGLANEESTEERLAEWWNVVVSNIRNQAEAIHEEAPTGMFVSAVREMLMSGSAYVVDITKETTDRTAHDDRKIGYCDGRFYYFIPGVVYNAVVQFYKKQERLFSLTARALYKIMAEDGVIEQDKTARKTSRQKAIFGKNGRYLWIPRETIDGRGDSDQLGMEFQEASDEIPEEFK